MKKTFIGIIIIGIIGIGSYITYNILSAPSTSTNTSISSNTPNNSTNTSTPNNSTNTSTPSNSANASIPSNSTNTSTPSNSANASIPSNSTNTNEISPTLASLYGTWSPTKIISSVPNDNSNFKLSDVKSNIIINSKNLIYKGQNAIIPTDDLNIAKASNSEFKESFSVGLSTIGVTTSSIYFLNGPQSLQFYITSPNTIIINLAGKFVQFTRQ